MIGEILTILFSMLFFVIPLIIFGIPVLLILAALFVRILFEYERGILFEFGKYAGVWEPGFHFIIPVYQKLVKVDLRVNTVDIPKQEVMTKDNVPVSINAIVYFRVKKPEKAILNVEDYVYAVSKYGQTSLRNVTGETSLDELLSERKKIAEKLKEIVDTATEPWGIEVIMIELQDIELPENLKRTMAKQAESERDRRATIIKAEGEVMASDNITKAAKMLGSTKGALHLRTLESLNEISSDQTNTIVFFLPLEVLRAYEEVD